LRGVVEKRLRRRQTFIARRKKNVTSSAGANQSRNLVCHFMNHSKFPAGIELLEFYIRSGTLWTFTSCRNQPISGPTFSLCLLELFRRVLSSFSAFGLCSRFREWRHYGFTARLPGTRMRLPLDGQVLPLCNERLTDALL
jgi:hypothetical protein